MSRKPRRDADKGSGGGDRAPLRPAARPGPRRRDHRGGAAAEPGCPRLRGPRRGSRDPRPGPRWRRGGAPLRWDTRGCPALLSRPPGAGRGGVGGKATSFFRWKPAKAVTGIGHEVPLNCLRPLHIPGTERFSCVRGRRQHPLSLLPSHQLERSSHPGDGSSSAGDSGCPGSPSGLTLPDSLIAHLQRQGAPRVFPRWAQEGHDSPLGLPVVHLAASLC